MWGTLADVAVARQLSDVVTSVTMSKEEPPSSHTSSEATRRDTLVEQACHQGINLVLTAASNNQDPDDITKRSRLIYKSNNDDDVEKECQERLRLLSAAASNYHLQEEVGSNDNSNITVTATKSNNKISSISQWKRKLNGGNETQVEQPRRKSRLTGNYLQKRLLPTTRKRKALIWARPDYNPSETDILTEDSQVPKGPPPQTLADAPNDRSRAALETWYKRLNDLYHYKQIYGDCNVPQKYELDPPLGVWVNKQRMEMKFRVEDKKSSLTQDKIDALRNIGFVWARSKGQKAWDQKYKELVDYKAEFGNCLVPTKYEKMPALGRWVSTQRAQYKIYLEGKESPMTQERVDKLSALGFTWNMLKRLNGNGEGESGI